MEAPFQGVIDDLQTKFADQINNNPEIKELVENIKAEYGNSDLKGKVILKQMLGDVLTDMDNVDANRTNRSIFKGKFLGGGGGESSKSSSNDATRKIEKEGLERVGRMAKYLKEKMEKPMGESVKELIGREKEKEEIIDQLVLLSRSGDSPVPVIAISGLAGIGKTKLARHVCLDHKLREQVGFPVWVHADDNPIYDTCGADFIAEQIGSVVQVTAAESLQPTNDFNIIVILDNWRVRIEEKDVKELQTKVRGRWKKEIEDMDLKNAVPRVRAIIITTRNSFLVRDIGDIPVKSYPLAGLDEKESALLLEKALGRDASDKVSTTNIVMLCRRVPLAIIAMAERLRDSSSALTPKEQLMYSYYEIGEGFPHQCFAYFSLFPRDFLFDAERLIHLWMAEGFLVSEETGRQYLMDLVGRSMLQDVKVDDFCQVGSFRMHPLMHDIAISVADWKDIIVDPNGFKVHREVSRVSFDLSLDFPGGIPAPLSAKAKRLKTLLFFANTRSQLPRDLKMSEVLVNIFKSFKNLQVLNLRDLKITTVPRSIGKLKDLKYLDLSQNNMETLPSSIAKLSNLETLKLSRCFSLIELPKDFEKLTRLKHLDIEGCRSLSCMPSHLGKLETLSAFVANKDVNNIVEGLCKLAELKTLRRRLEIVYRNWMQQFSENNIKPQTKLLVEDLTLRRDLETGQNTDKPDKSLDLLLILETHSELRVLVLVGYESSGLPAWFASSFENLVKLSLQDCPGCSSLNCQDKLPKLRILELIRLDILEYVEEQCRDAVFYKTLEELKISGCPKLESWWQNKEIEENGRPVFRCISKLHVHDCPKLTCMPLYPRLKDSTSSSFNKEMVLEGSSLKLLLDKPVVGSAQDCNIPLENLKIQNCNHLENLCSAFQQLSSLQRLTIENCAEANICGSGNQWKGLESLRFLTLREIPTLSSLSFGNSVTILRELTIHRCQKLTSIDSIGKLTSLRRLEISECNNLKSLPKEMKNLKSLKTLIILDCKFLLPRCQPETGGDWPQIRHITNKQVM
ncbi:hypothetical protein Fmac_002894 [Flemingia macrophylla]|uniref:NB-ARC domain-containing protein n=1 Tax=Flemingia macrophylla TaxID=520843 RepID=A0ABD1NL93_9FABA